MTVMKDNLTDKERGAVEQNRGFAETADKFGAWGNRLRELIAVIDRLAPHPR